MGFAFSAMNPRECRTICQRMATMMRSQGQGEQKESGGAEESATVKERPEGASPASRAGNSREFDVRRNSGEHVGDRAVSYTHLTLPTKA